MAFLLRCPICRGKFAWNPVKGMPKTCKLCHEVVGHDRADDDVVMPAFLSSASKANDTLYREMEQASERRAEAAAAEAGVPVEEMSGLRITDLNSTRHEGDVAAIPVQNEVTRQMDAIQQANPSAGVGFGGGGNAGLYHSAAVSQGAFPNVGARMRTAIQEGHSAAVRTACVGMNEARQTVIPSGDNVTSYRPALEAEQPGYRRRG